jgi:hypothetical protein
MKRKLITCPETVHLEVIEFEDTTLGTVIAQCSRLERCGLQCSRVCAALIDRNASPEPCDGPWSDDTGIVALAGMPADELEKMLHDSATT